MLLEPIRRALSFDSSFLITVSCLRTSLYPRNVPKGCKRFKSRCGNQLIMAEAAGKSRREKWLKYTGHINDPGVDIMSIVRSFDLPEGFPEKVMNQAQRCENYKLRKQTGPEGLTVGVDYGYH